jgi:hypothetical protein
MVACNMIGGYGRKETWGFWHFFGWELSRKAGWMKPSAKKKMPHLGTNGTAERAYHVAKWFYPHRIDSKSTVS